MYALSQPTVVARHPCIVAVRGSNGKPLAHIRFVVESAPEPVPEMGYVTDVDGQAHIGLPTGDVVLRFFLPDGASRQCALRIGDAPARTYVVKVAP